MAKTKEIKTNSSELGPYIEDGNWQLIPLHHHDYKDEHRGKQRERGKSPLHGNWTTRPYNSPDQVVHMEKGQNVGVRLQASQLVIDVDPRNFDEGDDPLARLCEDIGLDPDTCPTVETGSGGWHLYLTKPADIPVRDSLEDYPGVEFKTKGRQVVSAGSCHPSSKKIYTWDFLRPSLSEVPKASTKLLNIIKRPVRATGAVGGGEHDQEELARMLDALDPEDFREHDAWLTLMQACHHATNGDGRQEFVEWSTRDPEYTDHSGLIGRRWDSLHAGNQDGPKVTFRTLHKILRDNGAEATIPRSEAEDDFETVGPDDLPTDALDYAEQPEHEKKSLIERMNDNYWVVMDSGQFKIMWEETDPETGNPSQGLEPRKRWIKSSKTAFQDMLSNRRVQKGDKTIPVTDAWLASPKRRQVRGVVFDPERDHNGFLNLWTGWGVEPSQAGSWDYLAELLFEVLSDGKQEVYDYIMNWSAHMVQHPGAPAEVALAFQGGKGVGKGTFGRALTMIGGKHGMQVTSSDTLTGRFNSHLRDVILLFADEAIKPYDKDGESRLKALITEPTIAFEGKGADIVQGRNRLHVVMATNEDWFIPASLDDERRFLATHANGKWRGKTDRFRKLNEELKSGGLKKLLWDLLQRDIKGWHPRDAIPATEAMSLQKIRSLSPIGQWWFERLNSGEGLNATRDDMAWAFDPIRVFYDDVRDNYVEYCRTAGVRHPGGMGRSMEMMFSAEIKKLCPNLKAKLREPVPEDRLDIKAAPSDNRARAYEFPPLGECRAAFEALLGTSVEWTG